MIVRLLVVSSREAIPACPPQSMSYGMHRNIAFAGSSVPEVI
jgi:hypothetical protein